MASSTKLMANNTESNIPRASINKYSVMVAFAALLSLVSLSGCSPTNNEPSTLQQAADTPRQIQWKLATSWPKHFPGLGQGPERLANLIKTMSNDRLHIKIYGAGEIVPALEVFDAVSRGTVDMGHSGAYYWKGKAPAAQFFASVPFGLTAQEMNGWLHHGGGLELWKKVYAPYGITPMAGGNTGVQMGGWFNKEINTLADLKGLKMRIPGLGAEVLAKAGGTPITLPGGEIFTALQTNLIDATEWVGPYNDLAFGLHQVAKYYYYPGWHEPGTVLEFLVNTKALEALPSDLQAIVVGAARVINQDMLDEYVANNQRALFELQTKHNVEVRSFPKDVLLGLKQLSEEVLNKIAQQNTLTQEVFQSLDEYRTQSRAFSNISERAYLNSRELN